MTPSELYYYMGKTYITKTYLLGQMNDYLTLDENALGVHRKARRPDVVKLTGVVDGELVWTDCSDELEDRARAYCEKKGRLVCR